MGVMSTQQPQSEFPGPDEYPQLAAELRELANRHPAPVDLDRRVVGDLDVVRRPVAWGRGVAVAALIAGAIGVTSLLLIPRPADRMMAADRPADQTAKSHRSNEFMAMAPMAAEPDASLWDVTADGRVDVLDAFAVAKGIERGMTGTIRDFNSDGRLDTRDLDVLTARIVRVNTGKETDS